MDHLTLGGGVSFGAGVARAGRPPLDARARVDADGAGGSRGRSRYCSSGGRWDEDIACGAKPLFAGRARRWRAIKALRAELESMLGNASATRSRCRAGR